jgi:hypothetical protein
MSRVTTTDHARIRTWVERHGGHPAVASAPDGPQGALRIEIPGQEEEFIEHLSWDEWFHRFDARGLAFCYEDEPEPAPPYFKLIERP